MDGQSPWREVAALFSKIRREDQDVLSASYHPDGWNAKSDPYCHWYLSGIDSSRVHEHFKWAAERGAVLLGEQQGPGTLFFWLDLLRKDSPNYNTMIQSRTNKDGSGEDVECGVIRSVCLASEEYCFKLETEYIAKEPARKKKEAFLKFVQKSREAPGTTSPHVPTAFDVEMRAQAEVAYEQRVRELRKGHTGDGAEPTQAPDPPRPESVAEQLERLREESRLTVEKLAGLVKIEPRSVYRHLSGKASPRVGHIGAYERAFSKLLQRKIVISKTSPKRQ